MHPLKCIKRKEAYPCPWRGKNSMTLYANTSSCGGCGGWTWTALTSLLDFEWVGNSKHLETLPTAYGCPLMKDTFYILIYALLLYTPYTMSTSEERGRWMTLLRVTWYTTQWLQCFSAWVMLVFTFIPGYTMVADRLYVPGLSLFLLFVVCDLIYIGVVCGHTSRVFARVAVHHLFVAVSCLSLCSVGTSARVMSSLSFFGEIVTLLRNYKWVTSIQWRTYIDAVARFYILHSIVIIDIYTGFDWNGATCVKSLFFILFVANNLFFLMYNAQPRTAAKPPPPH